MRREGIILGAAVLLGWAVSPALGQETWASAAESAEVGSLFSTFFRALQQGDVQTIKGLLAEDLYKEYRVLLEENTEYSNFLVRYFNGVTLRVDEVTKVGSEAVATIRMTVPDGRLSFFKLNVRKKDPNQPWRVSRERSR